MKKAHLAILISLLFFLTACADSPSQDPVASSALSSQANVISSQIVKAFKDLYVVKKLELLQLEKITNDETAEKAFVELENLELEKNALLAQLGQSGNDHSLPLDGVNSQSERGQISVLNSKITQEELRLKNLRSYKKEFAGGRWLQQPYSCYAV